MAYSSLGYGAVFSGMQPCDHAWLDGSGADARPFVVESGASLWSYDVIFVSIAWELSFRRGQGPRSSESVWWRAVPPASLFWSVAARFPVIPTCLALRRFSSARPMPLPI